MKGLALGLMSVLIAVSVGAADLEATVRDTDADGRVLIDLAFPTPEGNLTPVIEVVAAGLPADFDAAGSGGGSGVTTRSILVTPLRFGELVIEVSVRVGRKTMTRSVSAFYSPRPVIIPGWVDDALVLEPPALQIEYRFLTIRSVLVNGEPANYGNNKMIPLDGVTYSGAILVDTALPGRNTVEIVAIDRDGETFTFKSSFVFAPDGVLRVGQVFNIHYGHVGSRSGPTYQILSSSDALERSKGAILWDDRIVETWIAARPGTATLTFQKKGHFLEEFETQGSFELRVEQ